MTDPFTSSVIQAVRDAVNNGYAVQVFDYGDHQWISFTRHDGDDKYTYETKVRPA